MCRLKTAVAGLALIVLLHAPTARCQAIEHEHQHGGHGGHDHIYELGLSTGFVHMKPEGESAVGTHLHLIRRFQGEGIWRFLGVGIGFETIFADHMHYNVMGTIAIYPYKNLSIGISPGMLIVEHDNRCELCYSTHVEVAYAFEVGQLHVGPVIGYARSGNDEHYFVGIHLGKGFN